MTENDLKILYLLNERNEIIENSLKKINFEFKKIKEEIKFEQNVLRLLGKQKESRGCINLLKEINNDINILENIEIKEKHKIKKIKSDKYTIKQIYLFEKEYDFEKINLKGLRIKNNYYRIDNWEDLIMTTIKEIEKNNYFLNYIAEYQEEPFLILTDYNFTINSSPFVSNEQKLYVNKEPNVNKRVEDLLGLIGINENYHYNDISIITRFGLKKKSDLKGTDSNVLDFKSKNWSGKKPKYFSFNDEKVKVESWIGLFVNILSLLKKDILKYYLNEKEKINFIHLKPNGLTRVKRIKLKQNKSVYIRGNYSAQAIKNKLKFLFLKFNYNLDNFHIVIK